MPFVVPTHAPHSSCGKLEDPSWSAFQHGRRLQQARYRSRRVCSSVRRSEDETLLPKELRRVSAASGWGCEFALPVGGCRLFGPCARTVPFAAGALLRPCRSETDRHLPPAEGTNRGVSRWVGTGRELAVDATLADTKVHRFRVGRSLQPYVGGVVYIITSL